MFNEQYIQSMIAKREFTKFDLKAELAYKTKSDKAELVKDIIAIANPPGKIGQLLFGVYDDGQPSGKLDMKVSEEQIQKIVKEYATPYIETSYEIILLKNHNTGLLTIYREPRKLPYRVGKTVGGNDKAINKDDIFYRHGRHSEKATFDEINALIFEGEGARHKVTPSVRVKYEDKYAMLDRGNRWYEMLRDMLDILFDELGFSDRLWHMEKRIRRDELSIYPSVNLNKKFFVEVADKVVGGHRYLFMFYVHPSDINQWGHLRFHRYAFEMVPKNNRVSHNWKRIVVIVAYGRPTKQSFKPFIEPITNNILVKTAFGFYCGPSELTARTLDTWEPRLYLTDAVSKECIKMKLQEALRWIEANPDLAEPAIKVARPFERYPSMEIITI
jgi:hypothetical protein